MTQVAEGIAMHALDQLSLGVKDLKTRLFVHFEVAEFLDYVLNLCSKGAIEALTVRVNDSVKF